MLPIVLRSLGPNAYGSYAHALALSGLLTGLFVTGFANHHTRDYVRSKLTPDVPGQVPPFFRLFLFQLIGAMVAGFANIAAGFLLASGTQRTLYLIAAVGTLLSCLNVDWVFYARNDIGPLFWRTLIVRIGVIALAALLLRSSDDLLIYAVLIQAANVLSSLIGFILASRQEERIWISPKKIDFINSRYFFASNVIGSIQQYADQIVVGIVFSKADLAYLSLCRQVLSAAVGVSTAACRALMPYSVRAAQNARRLTAHVRQIARPYVLITVLTGVGMGTLGAPIMQWLAGSRFHFPNWLFPVCGACFVATAIAVFIDTQISIPINKEVVTTRSNVAVALLILIGLVGLWKFPTVGYVGALWALFIAESVGVFFMLIIHKKIGTFREI